MFTLFTCKNSVKDRPQLPKISDLISLKILSSYYTTPYLKELPFKNASKMLKNAVLWIGNTYRAGNLTIFSSFIDVLLGTHYYLFIVFPLKNSTKDIEMRFETAHDHVF